jgi:hypothetical protein
MVLQEMSTELIEEANEPIVLLKDLRDSKTILLPEYNEIMMSWNGSPEEEYVNHPLNLLRADAATGATPHAEAAILLIQFPIDKILRGMRSGFGR